MKIETAFNPGGKAFVIRGVWGEEISELTVGRVTVEVTESPGLPDDATIDGMPANGFSNYAPQKSYVETIMCVETGVGSGSVYTYGTHAFTTRDAATDGQRRIKEKHAEEIARQEERKRQQREQDLAYHRRQLAELERQS